MYRYDRVDSPTMPRDSNESNDAPPTPALSSSAQSPRSSTIPSASTSTIDDPVHSAISPAEKTTLPTGKVNIADAST
jgi:mRNA-binding protein PUF3